MTPDRKRQGLTAARWLLLALLAGAYVVALVRQAQMTATKSIDEPLWFMRSQVSPWNLSTQEYRDWQVDVPSVNRWVYYVALKVTGLDKVPPDEKPCWSVDSSAAGLHFKGNVTLGRGPFSADQLPAFERQHGRYAPRAAILLMRYCNVATFCLGLAALWLTAWLVLRAPLLAVLPVSAIAFSAVYATDVGFFSWSGDVFMAAEFAITLAVWTWFQLKQKGTTLAAVVIVGLLCGMTASAKHQGIFVLVAFSVYLALQSRGFARIRNPVVACGVAFAAFAALNPLLLSPTYVAPWDFVLAAWQRRAEVTAIHMRSTPGPLTFTKAMQGLFFWWPIVPAGAYSLWSCRRLWWFPVVGLWGACLFIGALAGVVLPDFAVPRYLAPAELGLFFPVALAMVVCGRLAARRIGAPGAVDKP